MNESRQSARRAGLTLSIVSHGQRDLVALLLADLQRLQPPGVRRLVLTLNIDEPDPAPVALPGCEVQVLRNTRPLGYGANHNQAFRRCDTEWFAILNPDLRFEHDPFGPLLDAARSGDALLAPRIVEPDGRPADATRRLMTPLQLAVRTLGHRAAATADATDWLAGMCLLARSAAFDAVGGFDPRFFMYMEDADLSLRLRLAGWAVRQVDSATVVHAARRASRRSARHLRWHVTSLARHWLSAAYWRYLAARRRRASRAE